MATAGSINSFTINGVEYPMNDLPSIDVSSLDEFTNIPPPVLKSFTCICQGHMDMVQRREAPPFVTIQGGPRRLSAPKKRRKRLRKKIAKKRIYRQGFGRFYAYAQGVNSAEISIELTS